MGCGRWSIYGGVPATIVGALLSRFVGGRALLIASGVVLALVGARILLPIPESCVAGRARRRPGVVIPAASAIGHFTGLLANGGGFLLVSLFVLVLGVTLPESAGTSLVVIAVLSIPTLAMHRALGHSIGPIAPPSPAAPSPAPRSGHASRNTSPPRR